MTSYLIHSSILLSAISIFYWVALRHETFFRLNRWTIMLSVLLSLSLPLIHVPAEYVPWRTNEAPVSTMVEKIVPVSDESINSNLNAEKIQVSTDEKTYKKEEEIPVAQESEQGFEMASLGKILTILYFIGVGIFSLVFLMQLFVLIVSRSNLNSFKTGKYNIVEMVKDKEPFSFFNSIYINPANYDEDTYNHIIEHEKIHIDQSHFYDKIIAEILVIIFWFNPLTWLLRNGISRNLEFLTDQSLLNSGIQKSSYQMSLLKVSVSNQPFNLTMSYNSSFLKNRIDMMNAKKSSIVSSWKYLFIPPLFLLSIISLNALDGENKTKDQLDKKSEKSELVQKKELATPDVPALNEQPKKASKSKAGEKSKKSSVTPKNKVKSKSDKASQPFNIDAFNSSSLANRTLDIEPFTKLGVAINGDVELTYGSTQKVRVEGPEDLIDELDTEVKNGSWNIRFKDHKNWKKYKNASKLKFYITMSDLENLAISGNGNVMTTNKFKDLDRLMLAISGNGNMEIDADANSIVYAISGNGDGDLSGKTDELKITSSGNGRVDASELTANNCQITISGSGDVKVDVKDRIKATISGSANVYYKGNPSITKKVSGSGKFRRI